MNQLSFSLRRIQSRSVVTLFAAVVLLTGCKKDPEVDPTVPNTLSADAGPDQQGPVGTAVQLDGSASKDSKGTAFTYQWALTRKPAKSTTTILSPTTAKPTFTPDELGEYEVELTISNANGKSSDRMVVTAGVAQPTAITENIRVKTVLVDRFSNLELPDYVVTKSIVVSSELTINPGVVVAFERDTRLDINTDGGLLIAKGTADKKIRFIGVEKTKGFWAGMMIYSSSNANVIEHFELIHAGSRVLLSGMKAGMALFGGGKAQVAVINSLFAQNDGYGIFVQDGSILREFATNSFKENSEAPILLDAENVVKLDAASTFTSGNGRNAIEITTSTIKGTDEIVWAGFNDKTPYRLVGYQLTVNAGWKLSPGVTVELSRDASIVVNNTGYLNAVGTAEKKVTFTGAQKQASYWKGIMNYSANVRNLIENAEISNAGSVVIVSGKKAALAVYSANAKLTVKNTKISGSGGYGIFVGYGASVNADAATVNTFEANALASVQKE